MRKILILCCFALFSVNYVLAQDDNSEKKTFQLPKNEFHISWGDPLISSSMMGSWGYYYDPYYHNYGYDWFEPIAAIKKQYIIGSFSLSYYHRFKKWFWFGGTVSTTSNTGGKCYDAITKEPLSYSNQTYLGFAPAIRFSYLNRQYVTLYSGLSIGMSLIFNTIKEPNAKKVETSFFMYQQWTFFGASFGDRFFGNVELGVGNKGIISVGFGYKF